VIRDQVVTGIGIRSRHPSFDVPVTVSPTHCAIILGNDQYGRTIHVWYKLGEWSVWPDVTRNAVAKLDVYGWNHFFHYRHCVPFAVRFAT
jgi:hypothetical protein